MWPDQAAFFKCVLMKHLCWCSPQTPWPWQLQESLMTHVELLADCHKALKIFKEIVLQFASDSEVGGRGFKSKTCYHSVPNWAISKLGVGLYIYISMHSFHWVEFTDSGIGQSVSLQYTVQSVGTSKILVGLDEQLKKKAWTQRSRVTEARKRCV